MDGTGVAMFPWMDLPAVLLGRTSAGLPDLVMVFKVSPRSFW